jgi:hypothetical protein
MERESTSSLADLRSEISKPSSVIRQDTRAWLWLRSQVLDHSQRAGRYKPTRVHTRELPVFCAGVQITSCTRARRFLAENCSVLWSMRGA